MNVDTTPKVAEKTLKLIVFFWCIFQSIVVCMYLSTFANTVLGLMLSSLIWQIMTELGYALANYLGYRSTAKGKTVSNGKGGRIPFPDFIPNSFDYITQLSNLTKKEKLMRIFFSLSCSIILGILGILGLGILGTSDENPLFIFGWLILFYLLIVIWKIYQRLFSKIFKLKIAWYENSRPVFKSKI
ncbi:hypothetical protein WOSG25_110540 [Weissella oryzae SG25]|uniref:Uncharacterized protein n=1 Tax=Weissella oryzae (strain DSM 25784 / JCM 18191 / LMG 30913 / SG25) TaxID=1329250 RepID=A0A069D2C9_WEIOS|nr:hypothetical protein [Weissella oryzae]GAK31576.1 hypothetical protein WOSG25_110540 [Weissella oryzae SG25]